MSDASQSQLSVVCGVEVLAREVLSVNPADIVSNI